VADVEAVVMFNRTACSGDKTVLNWLPAADEVAGEDEIKNQLTVSRIGSFIVPSILYTTALDESG
jgi:hypothetical protein